ncbi:uncharacterized protein LOC133299272 [Gastrolobium bilobum]|uniref:uncharacterized protein LOC133299272 n=1 Tax=Gastrolobium bilobum TaxID=150636 RepID=UPI002AB2864B|nr:uncharacterized protein LOC133299272 [Gastrolobium bilobum]
MASSKHSSASSSAPNSQSSGDNLGLQITNHRLNGKNFLQWFQSVKLVIRAKGKMGYLEGKIKKPTENSPDYDDWEINNSLVMAWLTNSMEPQIGQTYLFFDTAKEIWDAVQQNYSDLENTSQVFELRNKLRDFRQRGMTVTEYFTALTNLWQELDLYYASDLKGLEANTQFRKHLEKKRLYDFLAGLNRDLDEVRGRILGQRPLPSLADAFAEVRREASRRRVMLGEKESLDKSDDMSALAANRTIDRSSGESKRDGRPLCTHCNKIGHTREKCWEIHGKPANWKPKGQNKGRAYQVSTDDKVDEPHASSDSDGVFLSKTQFEQLQRLLTQPPKAIAVAACIPDSWPVLILAPSSLRLQWASMIQQWLNIPSSDILIVLSQSGGSNRGGFNIVSSSAKSSIHLDGLFNIISYDLVPKLQNMLIASNFKVVIADESHFLKNAQAKRTTASLPVIKKAKYAILLSGTPALSRPIELFKQLEALYPDVFRNVHEYGNRYCKGGIFGAYQGASNHEELHNLMKATVMIRRLKKDVLSELPVKRRQQVFLELADKDMKQINALFRELEMVKAKIKASNSKEEAESLKFTQKNLINKIYTDSAEAKIPSVLDYVGTVIEAGCKFLIFAHHQPMIDSIHEFLLKKKVGCIRIDGSTPAASRQQLVTEFQEKDAIKAAVLSIKAGGVGLTLTAASTVIFAELSWTPGDLIQAEDRVHRIGQVSSVNIYYLLANDTVDDIIWDVVQSKLENLGQMLDGHENTLDVSASLPRNSPAKQRTLDQFVRRCDNMDGSEQQSNPKRPRK